MIRFVETEDEILINGIKPKYTTVFHIPVGIRVF